MPSEHTVTKTENFRSVDYCKDYEYGDLIFVYTDETYKDLHRVYIYVNNNQMIQSFHSFNFPDWAYVIPISVSKNFNNPILGYSPYAHVIDYIFLSAEHTNLIASCGDKNVDFINYRYEYSYMTNEIYKSSLINDHIQCFEYIVV